MATALIKQVQYLKENGFTEQQANTLIYFQRDHIEHVMATKKDLAEVHANLKKDIEYVKKDIEQLRADTKKDIAEVKKEIELLRTETKKDMALLKKDMILKLSAIMGSMITIACIVIKL